MDYTTSKAFVIGIGIFVTLIIVGSLILVFTTIADIYNATENTDTSIASQFDNVYSMYSGASLNALNLMNTLRKYETDSQIRIGVGFKGEDINYAGSNAGLLDELNTSIEEGTLGYEKMFDVSVIEDNNIIRIIFSEK